MKVSVYRDDALIGTAVIEHLDPPMGVAFGPFSPEDRYDRDQHANVIEGNYTDDRGQFLSVHADLHGRLNTASIAIEDWADLKLGQTLTIWFQDGGEFAALFSKHDDYRAYFDQ